MHRFRKAWRVAEATGCVAASIVWTQPCAAAKIACVGDSITYGYALATPSAQSYPAALQTLLGSAHTVGNFGVNSTTVLKTGDVPYWSQASFTASDDFKPNVIVIMLGTNDSKPQNWAHKELFAVDYAALIQHYQALGAAVYVAAPPPVYGTGAFSISPSVLNDEVVPLIHQIAADAAVPLIDVHQALSGKAALFPDNVHPNVDGAHLIAETVQGALEATQFGTAATPSASAPAVAASAASTTPRSQGSASTSNTATPAGMPSSGPPNTSTSAVPSLAVTTETARLPSALPSAALPSSAGSISTGSISTGSINSASSPTSALGGGNAAAAGAGSPMGPIPSSTQASTEHGTKGNGGCALSYGTGATGGNGWEAVATLLALFTLFRRDCFRKFGSRCV